MTPYPSTYVDKAVLPRMFIFPTESEFPKAL